MTTTLTTKGQVTIPKPIRELLGLKPGDQVEITADDNGRVTINRADNTPSVSRFRKFRGHAGEGMTTDEIMALTRGKE